MNKNDIDRFEKEEMNKIRPVKNTWYDWLIIYIPEPIRKSAGGFKVFLTQTHLKKLCMLEEKKANQENKMIKKPIISEENKEKNKDRMFRDIWTLFETEKEEKERKR